MTKKLTMNGENVFVDDSLNTLVPEGTYFHDAAIIPTVQYQVFGLDKVWFWDNEGQNYAFNKSTVSTIELKVVEGVNKTYYVVGSLDFGDEISEPVPTADWKVVDDFNSLPNDAVVGMICYTDTENEGTHTYVAKPVVATSFETTDDPDLTKVKGIITDDTTAPAGAAKGDVYYTEKPRYAEGTITTPYEFNKYGKEAAYSTVHVKLTPNETLAQTYPMAIITINGKEYDLKHKEFDLVMDKNYRISINWVWGEVVETFRIICDR